MSDADRNRRPAPAPRVLLLLGSLQVGGAERNVVELLPRLRAAGVDARLATLDRRPDSHLAAGLDGVPRVDVRGRRLLDPLALARLVRHVRRERIDVLHGEDHAGSLLGVAAAALTRRPLVVTRHVVDYPAADRRERVKDRLLVAAMRRGRVHRVLAVSSEVRRHLCEARGVPPERCVTVHNGVDLAAFDRPETPESARADVGWPAGVPVVAMVGVLRAGKGHDVLFAAVPRLREAVPDVHVVLVGGGPDAAAIGAAARRVGVACAGERADIPLVLRASDVVVLPSWSEALPTVLLEAGAAGVPVVATDVGGVREIVEDGATGFVVPPGDAAALAARLAELLRDPALRARLGAAARQRVAAHFTLDAQASATAAVYRDVLAAT